MEPKFFLKSTTIWGVIAAAFIQWLEAHGYHVSDLVAPLGTALSNLVSALVQIIPIIVAIRGRFVAAQPLTLKATSVTPPSAPSSSPASGDLPIKRSPLFPLLAWIIVAFPAMLTLSGCATTGTTGSTISADIAQAGPIVGDIITDVTTGAIAVSDAATALSAAQQTMGGHGVSIKNVGAYATAEASSINTSGLTTAVATLTKDISAQLSAGAPQTAITSQLTAAQNALSAVAPVAPAPAATTPASTNAPPTTLWMPPHQDGEKGASIMAVSY